MSKDPSVADYASYMPIGNAVVKLQGWAAQGAKISYLSSRTDSNDLRKDRLILERYKFPQGDIFYRRSGEKYEDVVEQVMPEIFVEDNCESIGGEKEMASPHVSPDAKKRIRIHVVPEFDGIDHLPDKISELLTSAR
ncbi:hypothetical protein HY464_01895 [Candidatus Peregrinibacteria bacterium]|nr:hypothetical protein [Candidatus Peregrinibacteria bacterium]MBI2524233.1 hypothetical protein [Candidatus Peregrinibacteria bacterium]MBI4129423.1 hypothetical protein [Candidatus Peregrinibacteria bacterium]